MDRALEPGPISRPSPVGWRKPCPSILSIILAAGTRHGRFQRWKPDQGGSGSGTVRPVQKFGPSWVLLLVDIARRKLAELCVCSRRFSIPDQILGSMSWVID
ncbi:hypothetical protein VFPPC_17505 [Pochonia chlamydosporia 170]|uniref:Uncharacterized protein n=1 Tax=Pochonia chlamydosporia 170 TaxID=1380566 RepID=A0A219ART4_METCM|nr:hypothetical protein VFPPC_17505 [Pochonia chlamydosporia 170]OWT43332.1 hypothetical protein VFPPC_17505 [Pochonia chlamydosporia 170]